MNERSLALRYYAFRVTNSAGFFVPVAVVVLLDKGFGMQFVLLSYAVLSFASVAVEIPTGYVGDWLGRRGSLLLGSGGRALVMIAYPLASSATAFLALHVFWATARAFRSGTADAWLYELLADNGDTDDFARVESRGSSLLLATSAVTAIAGSLLYGVQPVLPFFANAALAAAGIPLLFTLPRVQVDGTDDVFTVGDAVGVLRAQTRRPEIRWLVAFAGVFFALFAVTKLYEQPALQAVGVPVEGLGVLYAAFKLTSAAAASTAGWLEDTLGARDVFALMPPVYGVLYASIWVAPVLVVPVLFLNRGGRIAARPIRNQYLNDRLGDVGRATVLSGASMVLALGGGIARLVVGAGVSETALQVLPVIGVVLMAVAGLLWLATSPVRERAPTPGGEAADCPGEAAAAGD
jgi:hypothetical protein